MSKTTFSFQVPIHAFTEMSNQFNDWINRTPTGRERNVLCDLNIKLLMEHQYATGNSCKFLHFSNFTEEQVKVLEKKLTNLYMPWWHIQRELMAWKTCVTSLDGKK